MVYDLKSDYCLVMNYGPDVYFFPEIFHPGH